MSISDIGFKKEGYSTQSVAKFVSKEDLSDVLASPEISKRLEKFAYNVQKIAPKSDDFLYFTIIFLKSAEASLIDEFGNNRKVGSENAWGYFDDNYRWHGNVKPHRNNNGDIFPEMELKKATRKWIGTPLCVDHKSDSVDGIRGIVLDTHYDEKLKQVVGLCAVDKVNYPDLARKVKTGVVRYGSMGTGVETSICSECQNRARTPQEYCMHIVQRAAYGEINIGLKPIEYSLVVQPAEPGAILLRTIASIKQHGDELRNFGVDDLDEFTSKLNEKQANDLDYILYKTCGEDGCSLEQREQIVRGFLMSNGFIRTADEGSVEALRRGTEALAELARAKETLNLDSEATDEVAKQLLDSLKNIKRMPQGEVMTSGQYAEGSPELVVQDDQGVSDYTGTSTSGMVSSDAGELTDSFDTGGVGPESYLTRTASVNKERSQIASIMEEIMKETKLRQRAEQRRKIAYHFGGAHPQVEPATFKSEDYHKYWDMDKQMHPNPTNLGGADGMVPGDKEVKEQQKRAKDKVTQKKEAYHFGGAHPAVEPATFKSEDYHKYWDMDKQMHPNPTNLGGTDGMVPGDKEIKEQQKRAAYQGPRLSTKFKKRMNLDGSINKAASCFEVYAGDKLVIAATAQDIMGPALEQEWSWMTSKDYAKAVVAAIREEGLETVGRMLTTPKVKVAQELPEMPAAPAPGGEAAPADLPAPDMGADLGAPEEDLGGDEQAPKEMVEKALVDMEEKIDEIRSALEKLGGGEDVDINVNVGGEDEAEKLALSHHILRDLKVALAETSESADELAKISAHLEKSASLPRDVRAQLFNVSQAALLDSTELMGETSVLLRMANTIAEDMVKVSSYEEEPVKTPASKAVKASDGESELVKAALEMRRKRRENLLKMAEEMEEEEDKESDAHDGIGMKENAPVAGVAKDTAEDVARKQPSAPAEHGASPSTGNQDAQQHSDYSGTPSREVAEKSVTSVQQHAADDMSEVHEVAEDEAEEEVEKHEEEMHDKEDDASDALSEVKAKLQQSVLQKKAEEERQAYRLRVRRAYDLANEMQRKQMIGGTRAELDHQVDLMLEFDDRAFESFKRSVAAVKAPSVVKTASEGIGELNIGVGEKEHHVEPVGFSNTLSRLWEGK